MQEARTVALLQHPHIVRILDFDSRNGIPFLVMNYYPNGTVRSRYKKGQRVPLPVVIAFVKQAADALQYAHERKLIHRDIKPENMLIGAYDEILLGDFGIAVAAHSSMSMSTQVAFGTAPYMAPEQITGHARPASDQYALAITVYEWLCGERPFNAPSLPEIWAQHMMTPPSSLRARVPTIPADVEQVVMTALSKDPRQRFANVKAFATALETAAQPKSTFSSRGVEQTMLPVISPTIAASPLPSTRPTPQTPPYTEPVVMRQTTVGPVGTPSAPHRPQITWSDVPSPQPAPPRVDRARASARISWSEQSDTEPKKAKKKAFLKPWED